MSERAIVMGIPGLLVVVAWIGQLLVLLGGGWNPPTLWRWLSLLICVAVTAAVAAAYGRAWRQRNDDH